jgi:hypothetical protein
LQELIFLRLLLGGPTPPCASRWPGALSTSRRWLDAGLAVAADGDLRAATNGALVMVDGALAMTALVLRRSAHARDGEVGFCGIDEVPMILVGSPPKLSPDYVLASHVGSVWLHA